MATLKNTSILSTGFLESSSGTFGERPVSPSNGMIRYNEDFESLEYYCENKWKITALETGLYYRWYDSLARFTSVSHPSDTSTMGQYFEPTESSTSVVIKGAGTFGGPINWGDASQTGAGGTAGTKPDYLLADNFSWMAYGYIYAPETGTYFFGCDGDDAMDVYVNGVAVAYWYGGHGFNGDWTTGVGQTSLSTSLVAGNYYTFRARMNEGTGGDGMQVGWRKPSDGAIALIPSTFFFRKKAF